ncbi:hypothetical protein HYPSUDRAFT_92664 [Hypholoma sublateritium FD-334 SS-4]|uniref:HAT C-terminal dimerisation domain-containing protein n=1 Tax=Hypholoma sublateritium (strain FD-334 SS-4) TaxID=945553 RepID=A0A0D2NAW5_HYPSF|nr:hypothetical protein HYPSUDRAFT_92664 [Hypholoma sublateritium FD-334 SS-4]
MAPPEDVSAQKEAVGKAEDLFRYVATTYFDDLQRSVADIATAGNPSVNPLGVGAEVAGPASSNMSDGWLAGILKFDMVQTTVSVAATPKELFDDEIRRYLKFEGGRGSIFDPLGWWKAHEAAFPTIARMARDFLAIPATSVSVERTFSKSRHICSDLRASLKAETVTEALLSKVWIRSGLFDPEEPLKRKRKHGDMNS